MTDSADSLQETVALTTAPGRTIGEMWAEALRRNGVPVGLRPNDPGELGTFGGENLLGGVTLFVRRMDLDRAQEVIAELTGEMGESPPPER